ncbi:hypothetical protein Ancab_004227 [Ancistrocladus abbreviatus]
MTPLLHKFLASASMSQPIKSGNMHKVGRVGNKDPPAVINLGDFLTVLMKMLKSQESADHGALASDVESSDEVTAMRFEMPPGEFTSIDWVP